MKIKILNSNIYESLQLMNALLNSHPVSPILNNALLYIKNSSVFIQGTDLELEIISNIILENLDIQYNKKYLIPYKRLFSICKSLSKKCILNIEFTKDQILIQSVHSKYSLPIASISDFPSLNEWNIKEEIIISKLDLKYIIESTYFAMAHQDVRYYLNGILFEVHNNILRTIATDGHRLATSFIEFKECIKSQSFIVSRKGILGIIKMLICKDKFIKLQIGSNNIRILTKGNILCAKLIEFHALNYNSLLTQKYNKFAKVNLIKLKDAISRANVLAYNNIRGVQLNFNNNKLRINVNNPEQGQSEEVLDLSYSGNEIEISFNIKYIIDVLNLMQCKFIKISLINESSNMKIENYENSNNFYLIMPIKL